jgi:hypothetical protein
MIVLLTPVGPEVPKELQPLLKSMYDAITELQQPTGPSALWVHSTAATLEATAPAADNPGAHCMVDDINSIAVSTKIAGVYTWRRADGTAL